MTVDPAAPRRLRSLLRALGCGCLIGTLLAFAGHAIYVLLGINFHTVVSGQVYRSAQLSSSVLEHFIRTKHIRTIVNLRGCCDPEAWYLNEGRVALCNEVSLEDLNFSACRLPSSVSLRHLLEVLDHSPYPILFHCHKGADRTGMASAIALLLRTDTPLQEARQQLSFRYGHLPLGRTVYIDRFFDLYEQWLSGRGLTHSPSLFRRWIEEDYCPGECRCRLELLEPGGTGAPPVVHVKGSMPSALRVRCHNTSIEPWRLHPAENSGTHLVFVLSNDKDQCVTWGKTGLFHALVQPGEFIDLTVVLPGLMQPGRYELRLDMEQEQHAFFLQTGSQPLICTVEVP